MPFNVLTFLAADAVARGQKAPDAEARRIALIGGLLRPPALGIVAASLIARNAAPAAAAPPRLPPVAKVPVPDVTTAATGKESDHASHELWRQGFGVKVIGLGYNAVLPVVRQDPPAGAMVDAGAQVVLYVK